MLKELLDILYPRKCICCERPLPRSLKFLCLSCLSDLHKTNYHLLRSNPVDDHFNGRLNIEYATAFLHFKTNSRTQTIMHQIKYENAVELAVYMGELCGKEMKRIEKFKQVNAVLPVPIHPKKRKMRGYNQAELIAEGISKQLNVELYKDVLIKEISTESQTKKSRFDRYLNVGESFKLTEQEKIENKHLLLVDDVITTGSTLEACGKVIKSTVDSKLSILCLAATD